jgi:hypothetical protein
LDFKPVLGFKKQSKLEFPSFGICGDSEYQKFVGTSYENCRASEKIIFKIAESVVKHHACVQATLLGPHTNLKSMKNHPSWSTMSRSPTNNFGSNSSINCEQEFQDIKHPENTS